MIEKLHYVYVLFDPFDNKPFYVGKGTGRRADAHMSEYSETDKVAKIQSITGRSDSSLNQVLVRIIGRFVTEKEAFAVEATLIKWVYGLSSLTNLVHGHGSSSIRGTNDLSEIPGLDIERELRKYPMAFTSNAIKDNKAHRIDQVLSGIKLAIEHNLPTLNVSGVDMTQPKDPCVYLQLGDLIRVQLIVRPRKNGAVPSVIFNIRPVSKRREICMKFAELSKEYGYQVKGNKADCYFKIPQFLKASSDDNQQILDSLEGIVRILSSKSLKSSKGL